MMDALDPDVFCDLAELAIDRCTKQCQMVTQLMPNHEQRALMAIILAVEFIRGAEQTGMSRKSILAEVTEILNREHRLPGRRQKQ